MLSASLMAQEERTAGEPVAAAQMAFMLMERNSGNSTIDYPTEGSKGIVDALVRGIEKYGGRVLLRARVEEVQIEGESCCAAPVRHAHTLHLEASKAASRHQSITVDGFDSCLFMPKEMGSV